MIYKCRNCQFEEARGCLPVTSCGLYMLFLMGIATLLLTVAVRMIRLYLRGDVPHQQSDFGWWSLLLIPPIIVLGFAMIFVAALVLDYMLSLIEYLVFVLRKCPKCGSRRWSFGFTRGFGL